MEPVNIIHSLCIKIGDYKNTYEGNFIGKWILKRKINKLMHEFFNNDIFDQASALSTILINLRFGSNRFLEDKIDGVRVTSVSIELILEQQVFVAYITKNNLFDVDTAYNNIGGVKFTYSKTGSGSSSMDKIWEKLIPDIEDKFIDIIYAIADVLNNPMIIQEARLDGLDPFID